MMKEAIAEQYQLIQDEICNAISKIDGKASFKQDIWQREEGGGGRTRILQDGAVWEKAGVNFSAVHGKLPSNIQQALKVKGDLFYATGVSIVMHPHNPMVPIIHMNIRYFEIEGETWWFGGGIDLTPHYVVPAQAQFFHQKLKAVCDRYDDSFYPRFKKWADDYFFITHRNETRGIGGIFYDRLNENTGFNQSTLAQFSFDVGRTFVPTYSALVQQNKNLPFTNRHKDWQMLRRGRYVEFNLVYDKGTKFGLDTGGRIESILMSLPQRAGWEYDFKPLPNSDEERTLGLLKKEVDWVNFLNSSVI